MGEAMFALPSWLVNKDRDMRGSFLIVLVLFSTVCYGVINSFDCDGTTYRIARVIQVDNHRVTIIGTGKLGDQKLSLKLGSGQVVAVSNLLTGSLEYDEFYRMGDQVVVAQRHHQYHVIALFRLPILAGLMVLFAAGILCYARKVGLYALLSFMGALGIIFGVLIPGLVNGYPPMLITGVTVVLLCSMIIVSVAGWTIKGRAALAGCITGLMCTTIICRVVGHWLHLDGMTQPLAQPLFFENSMRLDMVDIFYAAILIGASGAAMDVAMEMAATMEEIQYNRPDIQRKALLTSGLRVGNAVIGTMTTTLLLAYAGGFLTLLMLFVSRGNSLMQILNMKLVASEICRTVIGSLSLIIVAPLTAWIASYLLTHQATDQMVTGQIPPGSE